VPTSRQGGGGGETTDASPPSPYPAHAIGVETRRMPATAGEDGDKERSGGGNGGGGGVSPASRSRRARQLWRGIQRSNRGECSHGGGGVLVEVGGEDP
jgi:hypothetical protein